MAAPKRANVGPAAAARARIGDETAAARLREHGWLVVPPELADDVARRARRFPATLVEILTPQEPEQ